MGKSQKLYKKAKTIIPGGNQLLSKRPEMFLPGLWPSYYTKSKGCEVWDLDDQHYYDMGIMGIGTSVLGYANPTINKAVKKGIDNSNMCTLNAPEEVELAQMLLDLHPWAHMARFAKSGGESNTIAIRIARAFSKKDKIAFCGYHGWHDWYISANLNDASNLDNQLLPGLSTNGVPKALKNTVFPFEYSKIEQLENIVKHHADDLGVIIMEVQRYKDLDLEFLRKVRKIATKIGAVLIFDEISSGFRINTGGIHLLHDIIPDIVVYGKALGNGFPIGAIVGKKNVMQAAQDTFISSSYWTERSGYIAAIETLKFYKKHDVSNKIVAKGKYLEKNLNKIFKKYNLNISTTGLPSILAMAIKEESPTLIKTIFIQEMLKKGYLAATVIYVSYAHKKKIMDKYLKDAEAVFKFIAKNKKHLEKYLENELSHSGFQRLN
jgi:glutamate-1-semialdehyde 2,1-aminomutase